MSAARLHDDETPIDVALVRELLAAQFPRWADLPLEALDPAGTDHALYRLGAERLVRLPLVERVAAQDAKEHAWLPRLAPHLPLAVPEPLARGAPAAGYPWPWSVYRRLEGEAATTARLDDPREAADALADFVRALHAIDPADGPAPGTHNFHRGVPLAERDGETRAALASLEGTIDVRAATAVWEAALRAGVHGDPPVWIHGDLAPGNVLVAQGRLAAVLDFGGLAVGDPACDLIVAWNLLAAEARARFRDALAPDDAAWARGRGWALSTAAIALPYYRRTRPAFAAEARRTLEAVLGNG